MSLSIPPGSEVSVKEESDADQNQSDDGDTEASPTKSPSTPKSVKTKNSSGTIPPCGAAGGAQEGRGLQVRSRGGSVGVATVFYGGFLRAATLLFRNPQGWEDDVVGHWL